MILVHPIRLQLLMNRKKFVPTPVVMSHTDIYIAQIKTRGSLDTLEKVASPEKSKDEKRKEKKPGMLSGLFKRKDKKGKSQGEEDDSELLSREISGQPLQPKVSSESTFQDGQSPQSSPQQRSPPQRQSSKLQKAPPKLTPLTKRPPSREGQGVEKGKSTEPSSAMTMQRDQFQSEAAKGRLNSVDATNTAFTPDNASSSLRMISPDPNQSQGNPPSSPTESKSRGRMFSPIRDVLRSSPAVMESKPERVKPVKQRVVMDDFDSSPEAADGPDPLQQVRQEDNPIDTQDLPAKERLSESPIQVSPGGGTHPAEPPPLVRDHSSPEEPSISPVSSTSTPEFIEAPPEESSREETTPVSTVQSSTNAPTWSDASLRSYVEDDTDIRDLLVLVYDKSDTKPVGPDHPMSNMCKEENRRLGEMSTRLDGLLQDFLARQSRKGAR